MTLTPEEPEARSPEEADEPDQPSHFDMSDLMAQAQTIQRQVLEAHAAVAVRVVEGQAGGGVVKMQVTGDLNFRSVVIDPDVVDPDDVEMLQDLVLAAARDAMVKVHELNAEALGGFSGPVGGLLP